MATDADYDIQRNKANCRSGSIDNSHSEIFINDYDIELILRHLKNSSRGSNGLPALLSSNAFSLTYDCCTRFLIRDLKMAKSLANDYR